jgi:hypothetical protein
MFHEAITIAHIHDGIGHFAEDHAISRIGFCISFKATLLGNKSTSMTVLLRFSVGAAFKWHFFPGLPKRSPEIVPGWTFGTLDTHNSSLQPPIEVRSEPKL